MACSPEPGVDPGSVGNPAGSVTRLLDHAIASSADAGELSADETGDEHGQEQLADERLKVRE